ncbi:MAG TPA: hypothetical protein PLL10_08335 [Elusimicrobiales bacterium]|nr:hypothetical protein [Elusimicrobiales bacterium]
MDVLYGICAVVVTISFAALAVQAIFTLRQLRETAEQVKYTAKAVELAALNTNDRIEATKNLFDTINHITQALRSGWFKGAQLGLNLLSMFRRGPENK